eukprot:TRINITY_DN54_c0_g2_i1.p1 TRINITY_DN54_c0_g2~~TRINITY_DN54_c0_g2_i1.p1  ORF type:complete len:355 (+),score=180.86 TRINITY_DN54_c0_g2_i1:286-1350(+)
MGCMSSKSGDGDESKTPSPEKKTETHVNTGGTGGMGGTGTGAGGTNITIEPIPALETSSTGTPSETSEISAEQISLHEGITDTYEFGRELGTGAYSIVHEARKKDTGEMFAVKTIDLQVLETEGAGADDPLQPIKREIVIMKKVDHPNIIKLYEIFSDDDVKMHMVMELMPNNVVDLFAKIDEKKTGYSEPHASHIFRQIVSAVEYLHSMGVAHRDLKPENLLISGDDGQELVKLTDFGFAKHFKGNQLVTSLGSPGYAAPELFTMDKYDEKVDVWSLGVICYVLLSGTPPFYGETLKELTERIIAAEFDFDDACWETVSRAAKDLICHMLEKVPQKRYSAKQCADDPWTRGAH